MCEEMNYWKRLFVASAFSLAMLKYSPSQLTVIKLDDEAAKRTVEGSEFISIVGHESTAKMMTELLGVPIPVNRSMVQLEPGDIVLVFQIMVRLPEGKVLTLEELKETPHAWYKVYISEP
ncbi:MAG: DUF1874 domain-containing protein [Nitrososphaerota archaeon]